MTRTNFLQLCLASQARLNDVGYVTQTYTMRAMLDAKDSASVVEMPPRINLEFHSYSYSSWTLSRPYSDGSHTAPTSVMPDLRSPLPFLHSLLAMPLSNLRVHLWFQRNFRLSLLVNSPRALRVLVQAPKRLKQTLGILRISLWLHLRMRSLRSLKANPQRCRRVLLQLAILYILRPATLRISLVFFHHLHAEGRTRSRHNRHMHQHYRIALVRSMSRLGSLVTQRAAFNRLCNPMLGNVVDAFVNPCRGRGRSQAPQSALEHGSPVFDCTSCTHCTSCTRCTSHVPV